MLGGKQVDTFQPGDDVGGKGSGAGSRSVRALSRVRDLRKHLDGHQLRTLGYAVERDAGAGAIARSDPGHVSAVETIGGRTWRTSTRAGLLVLAVRAK